MTLDGMEKAIASRYHINKRGEIDKRRCNPHKVNFMSYIDDFFTERVMKCLSGMKRNFLFTYRSEMRRGEQSFPS